MSALGYNTLIKCFMEQDILFVYFLYSLMYNCQFVDKYCTWPLKMNVVLSKGSKVHLNCINDIFCSLTVQRNEMCYSTAWRFVANPNQWFHPNIQLQNEASQESLYLCHWGLNGLLGDNILDLLICLTKHLCCKLTSVGSLTLLCVSKY